MTSLTKIYQGPATNLLAQIRCDRSMLRHDCYRGTHTYKLDNLTVTFKNPETCNFSTSTKKLLDYVVTVFTREGTDHYHSGFFISIADIASFFGKPRTKPSMDKLRRNIKRDCDLLENILISYDSPHSKKAKSLPTTALFSDITFHRGGITFRFTDEFRKYLLDSFVTYLHTGLFQLDERNPCTYIIGRKLCLQFFNRANQKRKSNKAISVSTLLKALRDVLPSQEAIHRSNRAVNARLVKPLEAALNLLATKRIIKWRYRSPPGQQSHFNYASYASMIIDFEIVGIPYT